MRENNVIVTGLPRSGTSLMMNILKNNGYLVEDYIKKPKEFNEDGYFETEETCSGIREKIRGMGKAYKVILYAFLKKSVIYDDYKVIFCVRNPYAIAVSQQNSDNGFGSIEKNLEQITYWYFRFLNEFKNREHLVVDYDEIFEEQTRIKLSKYLGFDVEITVENRERQEVSIYKKIKR